MALTVVGGYLLYDCYQHRPQPQYVQARIQAPPLRNYENPQKPVIFPLLIHFNASAAPPLAAGGKGTAHVRLQPEVAGEWTWRNDRTLVFYSPVERGSAISGYLAAVGSVCPARPGGGKTADLCCARLCHAN